MFLDTKTFANIVQKTPLIAIDLIVKNELGQVLLGKRVNKPAQNSWFVPGGRVFKDETLDDAFTRIVYDELGVKLTRDAAIFHGLYEHFYDNNVFNDDFSTHYIVLAHAIQLNEMPESDKQHSSYKWFTIDKLLDDKNVYTYTKDYFRQ
ncbi:GDP-mannose mannosyl hydrolase [Sulfurimonas sp. SAG-AH-194-C21]|nr:GDP-mannose mannosyl hydrolase [Sulfurimonas sp. SAG-AH-194-C21]MDF1884292.1 GDP-mannose mannosyl hydrolase [Sulfurimonas sp. SAG-AH-194-C21]